MSIVAEVPGYAQVFSDGSVKRIEQEKVPASSESSNGYKSKDVIVDPSKPVTARIFLPDVLESDGRLPVIAYFHGGGFCVCSTAWAGYHNFLGDLAVASQSIIFSIDYRLAPENRLPAAYEDCYGSLEWLFLNAKSEPWLEKADLSRLFLCGDSAGGNMVHQVAVMAIQNKDCPFSIKGLLPVHPFFGSEARCKSELEDGSARYVAMNDIFWGLAVPQGSNRDYHGCNFEKTELTSAEWKRFPSTVVFVAGLDFLKERGVLYAEFLQRKNVKGVKLIEAEGQPHVFYLFNHKTEPTVLIQKQISEFINSI